MNNNLARSRDSWSGLPTDLLLTIIGDRLKTRIDILRLRAVCPSWRSAIPIYKNNTSTLHLPMQLPYPGPYIYFGRPPPSFQVPDSTLVETILFRIEPLHHDDDDDDDSNCIIGGWLIKVKEVRPNEFRLLNYDASKIPFPRNLNLLEYRVFELGKSYGLFKSTTHEKTIFSSEHNSMLAILDGKLAFFRFEDEKWTKVDGPKTLIAYRKIKYKDIIMYKSEFHAVDKFGYLVRINASNLDVTRISHPLYTAPYWWMLGSVHSYRHGSGGLYDPGRPANSMHLVQVFGDLYLVVRPFNKYGGAMYYDLELNQYIYNDGRYEKKMHDIKVYKLNEERNDWVKVQSLGDKVIILSFQDSFIIASPEELAGFKGNCIYFADQDIYIIPEYLLCEY